MISAEKLVEHLNQSLGHEASVVFGWVNHIKDFTIPVVSVTTYDYWPNHADLNVWACTIESRDKITAIVIKTVEQLRINGLSINNIMVISLEEEGILQPGSWKVLKKSKPMFRKLVQITLS